MSQAKRQPSGAEVYVESFATELVADYFQYDREKPRRQPEGKFGFCYVDTPLGVLELRLDALLSMIARLLNLIRGGIPGNKTVITEDVVETSLEVRHRIPQYIVNDLIGMIMEAQFDLYAFRKGKPEVWRPIKENLSSPGRDEFRLITLGALFEQWGILSLEMDPIRTAFEGLVSTKGVVRKPWKKFLSDHFRKKKQLGRPRSREYDRLLNRRTASPTTETYGKLMRELVAAASVPPDVARNRLKAAAAYRRKKARIQSNQANPPAGKETV